MKVLLLIPHNIPDSRHEAVRKGERPQADYDAVAEAVRATSGGQADILDRNSVGRDGGGLVHLVSRLLGINWALALLGFQRCREYDVVLTHSEMVGLPFSMLIAMLLRRPRHVMTAYYLDGKRNAVWYRILRAHKRIDKIFVLGQEQYETGAVQLGLPKSKLILVESCGFVDSKFFATVTPHIVKERQICSVGREFRDFETLIKAITQLPDINLKIDPASPWSLHRDAVGDLSIPSNVEICHMELGTVRSLYAESAAVVIPLHPNPIGAGRTTLVEAMASGKPVIVTKSKDNTYAGRSDIIDGNNVILVNPSDVDDMRHAIERLINDQELSRHIGGNARRWTEQHAGRQEWLNIVLTALGEPVDLRDRESGQVEEVDYADGHYRSAGQK